MGKRGPPPKPTTLKQQQGTYRADRDPMRGGRPPSVLVPLPELPPGAPPCPPELDEEARRVWHEVFPRLMQIGTLDQADGGILRGYCALLVRVQKLETLAAEKPIIESKTGPKVSPAGVGARKLWPLVEKLASDLGLNYAARARAGAPPTVQDAESKARYDAAERFLFGREPFMVIEGGKTEVG